MYKARFRWCLKPLDCVGVIVSAGHHRKVLHLSSAFVVQDLCDDYHDYLSARRSFCVPSCGRANGSGISDVNAMMNQSGTRKKRNQSPIPSQSPSPTLNRTTRMCSLCLFPGFAFIDDSPGLSLARSFSFASSNLLAVPVFVLNSSGKSTEGFPSNFNLSSVLVFASCCVLEGRETYGRVDLHS